MRLAEFLELTGLPIREVQRASEYGFLSSDCKPGSGNYRDYSAHDVLTARVVSRVRREFMAGKRRGGQQSRLLRAVAEACRQVENPLEPGQWLVLSFKPAGQWRLELLEAGPAEAVSCITADNSRDYLLINLSDFSLELPPA
jgi:hypothetical protein